MKRVKFLYCFNDKEHFRRFLWGMVFLAVFAGAGAILVPQAVAAAFSCNGATANGNLFVTDTISNTLINSSGGTVNISAGTSPISQDDPFAAGTCTAALGVFGRVICFFKTTVGQIVSTIYCNFQNALLGPLSITLELFIVILGVFFMTGMTHLTAREAIVALLKIALVWAFAMNATWGIGIAYSFFMGLAEEGTTLVLTAVNGGSGGSGGTGGGAYLTQVDKILGSVFNYTTLGSAGGNPISLPSTLTSFCALMLFTFFVLLIVALPTMGGAILAMIIQYIWLYARALLGYLSALVLIGLLFILSPIFLSFALFKTTRSLFEKWLQYLTSYSLQMIIVFAFLALLNLIPIGDFFMEILSLVRQYNVTWGANESAMPATMCSVCRYNQPINNALVLGGSGGYPITCASDTAIPISQLFTSQDLVQAVLSQAIALWIIGNVMLDFLKKAPEFARDLTGRLPFASLLGGPSSNSGAEGITFFGQGQIEDKLDQLQATLKNPATYQGWKRFVPAGLIMAPAFAAIMKRTGPETGSVPLAPGSTAANSYDVGAAVPNAYKAIGDIKPLTTTLVGIGQSARALTMAAGSSQSSGSQTTVRDVQRDKAVKRVNIVRQRSAELAGVQEKYYEQTQDAYKEYRRLLAMEAAGHVVNPIELARLRQILGESGGLISGAMISAEESRMGLARAQTALLEREPDGTPDTAASLNEQRNQVATNIKDMQLVMDVQSYLLPPERVEELKARMSAATAQFSHAQSKESLDGIQAMLNSLLS